jgi:hypothetical protein
MKHRFESNKKDSFFRNLMLSLFLFGLIFFIFHYAVGSVSSRTMNEEKAILEEALNRSITHCYAIEGRYPESLDYLKNNYGLTYNEDLFYVDYQPLGSDLLPDITIIVRKGDSQ